MKALALRGLLYLAKLIAKDVIRKKFLNQGAPAEGADVAARVQVAKLENLSNLVK